MYFMNRAEILPLFAAATALLIFAAPAFAEDKQPGIVDEEFIYETAPFP